MRYRGEVSMSHEPLVVSFEHADPTQVQRLGAKGAKLVEDFRHIRETFPGMEQSIAVPDGFIITTDFWRLYHEAGDKLTDDLFGLVLKELNALERRTNRRLGDCSGRRPLIVAVRGGAPISLPGALGTILNVGLNDEVVESSIRAGENESFALTTYLTGIRMYGEVVLDIQYDYFYEIIKRVRAGDEGTIPVPLLRELITAFKGVLTRARHPRFPSRFETNLHPQLRYSIEGVLSSWMSTTAIEARRSRKSQEGGVSDAMGTAVIIQEMVFGNRDDRNCLSGVLFTRDQRTGANTLIIEWAPKVQCDKIVSGKLRKQLLHTSDMKERFPDIYDRLFMMKDVFETRARRPLDMEFTVENRRLYLLQRRPLRMTTNGAVRSVWDFVDEGKTNIQLASMIINKALEQPEKGLRDNFHDYIVLAKGEPITDSADCGALVFGTEAALELAAKGEHVILLRRRPYGETDVAVNHPLVRGIIRCDGNTTGHEAVSAVAYCKPYIINMRDSDGNPLTLLKDEQLVLNPESIVHRFIGKRVFVDGERGILGYTEASSFLEDRRSRKKLYVDWEYLRRQFDQAGYQECDYDALLDLHYQWELDLEGFQHLERRLRENDPDVPQKELLNAFSTYLQYIPKRDRERVLRLKDVQVEDFDFGPPLAYHGKQLGREVLRILKTLMLCTTWCTHWVHEIMVVQARQRGETENDVIRDIFLKNRTMSMVKEFEDEGFHVMRVPNYYHLILASNFEYSQDPDKVDIGPGALNYKGKEILARQFLSYLEEVNPLLHRRVRMIQGEPPLGQGHARIISIGLSIPHQQFDLVCRYLRTFLDRSRNNHPLDLISKVPRGEFIELYQLDPFFAPYPDLSVTQETLGADTTGDCLLALGKCSYGEFDGSIYGREDYENLTAEVSRFEGIMTEMDNSISIRPWQFEVDPYRRHSVIAAVGIRFNKEHFGAVLEGLKKFLAGVER
jgi:hypothetical protein